MREGAAEEMLAHEAVIHARFVRRAARRGLPWTPEQTDAMLANWRWDTLETRATLTPTRRYYALAYDTVLRRFGYPICHWPASARERLRALSEIACREEIARRDAIGLTAV